jgi:hypothetical protein
LQALADLFKHVILEDHEGILRLFDIRNGSLLGCRLFRLGLAPRLARSLLDLGRLLWYTTNLDLQHGLLEGVEESGVLLKSSHHLLHQIKLLGLRILRLLHLLSLKLLCLHLLSLKLLRLKLLHLR